ncbi:MAG: uracil-DNA glycosylase [Chitinophagales bacterium]|nr:uracil-DNA glycosylase [Chitinophagales bacterium]
MSELLELNSQIQSCQKCPQLITYIEGVAKNKVKRFMDQEYWGKPVPSFGDQNARLFIVGLAPAAHGANRCGRMFTGDSSGDWLFKALYETGFANQPQSLSANDGMELNDAYVSSVIHCAPPANKPSREEIQNCSSYLSKEIEALKEMKVLLCLGQISFKQVCNVLGLGKHKFGHGVVLSGLKDFSILSSYHPSRQNTQTGRLKWAEWLSVFELAKAMIKKH